jgi:hypothetical protein
MILKLLNWQGIAGIAASLALAILLLAQKAETRHWRKQSASFDQLYRQEQSAFATTIANYRAAANQARAADAANLARVAREQRTISKRTAYDYETRLAAARADAQRLRGQSEAAGNSGAGRSASMSGVPPAPSGAAQAPGENQLSAEDALTATEQAIQLDELIKWVRSQAKVDNDPRAIASPPPD